MIHFIVNKSKYDPNTVSIIASFFKSFIDYIKDKEILVINADPLNLDILNLSKSFSSNSKELDPNKAIVYGLTFTYGEPLKYVRTVQDKIKDLEIEPDVKTSDLSMLKVIIPNYLNITVTCIDSKDALTRFNLEDEDNKDFYKNTIVTLFSSEKDKVENGIRYFNIDFDAGPANSLAGPAMKNTYPLKQFSEIVKEEKNK